MDIKHFIAFVFVGVIFGLYESTAMTFLNPPLAHLHPTIIFLVFLITTDRIKDAYAFALAAALTRDFFSIEAGRFFVLEFLLLALALKLLAERILTNQSLYAALAMDFISRLFDWLWTVAMQAMRGFFGSGPGLVAANFFTFWPVFVFDAVLLCLVFFFGKRLFRRFLSFRADNRSANQYGS